MAEALYLKVVNRNGIVYQGRVGAVSSRNSKGTFDVVDRHTNFITLLNAPLTIHQPDGNILEVAAENGVMKVFKNRINVYLGIKSGLR
jgi:F0F1-type ATP synthase epsilon subunit